MGELRKFMKNIPKDKVVGDEIPINILKQCDFFTYSSLKEYISNAFETGKCKIANVTPVHKKDETTGKENHRPVSVLP